MLQWNFGLVFTFFCLLFACITFLTLIRIFGCQSGHFEYLHVYLSAFAKCQSKKHAFKYRTGARPMVTTSARCTFESRLRQLTTNNYSNALALTPPSAFVCVSKCPLPLLCCQAHELELSSHQVFFVIFDSVSTSTWLRKLARGGAFLHSCQFWCIVWGSVGVINPPSARAS